MDRRKFLSRTGVAGLVTISGLGEKRLYGQPASSVKESSNAVESIAPHLYRLHLAIEGADISRAGSLPAVMRLAKGIIADRMVAEAFSQDPNNYLGQIGFAESNFDTKSIEFKMIQALANEEG